MTPARAAAAVDWPGVRLVAFDVDGTLYRQRPVRRRMARALLADALARGRLDAVRTLFAYRRLRERLAEREAVGFEAELVAATAAHAGVDAARVREIVARWIEQRPLQYLALGRRQGVDALFAGLRRHGKVVGVLSDYPAVDKLAALGLAADHVVSAGDPAVGLLKPHPRGLEHLAALAGAAPAETLLVGDRVERDGVAARRAGAQVLIVSARPIAGWPTVAGFEDPVFAPMLSR